MRQLSLLPEPSSRTLVDNATGRIVYHRSIVDPQRAERWFDALRAGVEWRAEQRPMYDRIVDVPRLVASFALDEPALPGSLAEAERIVQAVCGFAFTRVGLNLYRDRNDSVAPHGDHTEGLDPGAPVALLSLGATRRMELRSTAKPRRAMNLELEAGSLLVMDYASQLGWLHGVPKQRREAGPRISVAFRRGRRAG